MKTTALLATLAVLALPQIATAMGCSGAHSKETASMSCAEGTSFDAETKRCVPVTG